ncbi:recombinase family protein [Oscillospiraceae bacterium PP1C4]
MARTKNRETNTAVSQFSCNLTRWNLAKYIRLSKEDLNRGKDDSNSVTNQKKLLDDYYRQHLDEFESAETYVDDGCTGTDTNRADFQRLLADIYAKKVNCVIVKDLSRLSRNYTDAASLIENLFVQMNVRFISLAVGVDSYLNPDSVSSILVPITNVMNDQYCYQTSKKIRQVFDYKKRNGEFIGSYAPYGYIKDPNYKHALLVDHEAAEVVKQIFSMCLSGMTVRAIVNHLNDHSVMCPSVYKQSQGLKYKCPNGQTQPMWSTITISNMLKNPVYVGDMAQGRNRVKSYKIHKIEAVPEKDWIVVQNTHEPIIDRDAFEKVKQLLKRDTRTSPKQKQLYLFSGFLRCADCGRAMSRIASKELYVYYQCGTYKSISKKACTMHSIKSTRLEAAVLYGIRQQVHLAVSYPAIVSKINLAPLKKSQSARLNELIATKEKELAKIMRYKQALYQDWKDGHITHNDYRHMSEDYEQQNEAIGTVIANLKKERVELENGIDTENPFLASFRKYENIDKLAREILIELVDHIKVYEGGDISIRFKFADELRRIIQYIEVNSHLQVG